VSDETKELAIGEEGVIDGVKVRCSESCPPPGILICDLCRINSMPFDSCKRTKCADWERSDKKQVIFEEVK